MRRIYLYLPEPVNVAFAIGALAGLRTGEVLALRWAQVDLETRRIHVRESLKGPLPWATRGRTPRPTARNVNKNAGATL